MLNRFKFLFCFILLLKVLLPVPVWSYLGDSRELQKNLKELSEILPENYLEKATVLRKKIEKNIVHRQKICRGEFSTLVMEAGESSELRPKKLGPLEKDLCLRDLKKFQIHFLNTVYELRKKYLVFLHRSRLQQLEKSHQTAVKDLEKRFYLRPKRLKKR